jgi:hypothetical protein
MWSRAQSKFGLKVHNNDGETPTCARTRVAQRSKSRSTIMLSGIEGSSLLEMLGICQSHPIIDAAIKQDNKSIGQ